MRAPDSAVSILDSESVRWPSVAVSKSVKSTGRCGSF